MPGVDLNSFKRLRKEYKNLSSEYSTLNSNSFNGGYLSGDRESLWDAMWRYSDLYDSLDTLGIQIEQQLRACSDLKNRDEYEGMISDIESLKSDCISDYNEIKSGLGQFSDSERRRMEEFRIDRL
ncbi:hypothetical protein C671_3490 [[Clostridium] bifermentans ATCC 19299]|uniref:hypothetical protein n=1 Tax=Paraclostridium bifermentans TaxID=1490 RepID=UPI00038C81BD|nr:hypothetical protein [Paraclostridium bifermentans]EQK37966.1 hypothetical protein C671_3490 [[Clostridium] bifermentans ATCC 19299] [Paraclostridium bifermentans ATCC 19299]